MTMPDLRNNRSGIITMKIDPEHDYLSVILLFTIKYYTEMKCFI